MDILQNPFVGAYELRKNLPRILSSLKKEEGSPVVITHQGKPQAVIMAVEYYFELIETLRDLREPEYIKGLRKSKEEILGGRGIPAEEAYKKLGI